MTVDWSGWLTATPEQQDEMWRNYRRIVKAESDAARENNYARMIAAIGRVGASYKREAT